MGRFIEGCEWRQALLLADCVDDYVGEENPVRVIDAFVDELDFATLGFEGAAATGRPGYHPGTLLKLYLYGYMNQVPQAVTAIVITGHGPELTSHVCSPLTSLDPAFSRSIQQQQTPQERAPRALSTEATSLIGLGMLG